MGWKLLTIGERLGRAECPYLRRWVIDLWLFSVRVHHWIGSDDPRYYHDHPWPYVTLVVRGSYLDRSPAGDVELKAPMIAFRRSGHRHTVQVAAGGCWTVMLAGPEIRRWGFWVRGKFVRRNKFFFRFGPHPCDGVG
jgi:hypothetical protein